MNVAMSIDVATQIYEMERDVMLINSIFMDQTIVKYTTHTGKTVQIMVNDRTVDRIVNYLMNKEDVQQVWVIDRKCVT